MALRFRLRTLLIAVTAAPFLIFATLGLLEILFYAHWIGGYALKLTVCRELSRDRQLQRLEFFGCIDLQEAENVKAECVRAQSEGRRPVLPLDVASVSNNEAVLQIRIWGKTGDVTGRELEYGEELWIVLELHWDDASVEHYIVELPKRNVRGSREAKLLVDESGAAVIAGACPR